MRWGDVILVDLEPVIGSESNKTRPAVVVSNDGANRAVERFGRGVLTVAPITSNVARIYPFQVAVPTGESGLLSPSKIQAEQVRSVDSSRVIKRLGRVPAALHGPLRGALVLHLGLRAS